MVVVEGRCFFDFRGIFILREFMCIAAESPAQTIAD